MFKDTKDQMDALPDGYFNTMDDMDLSGFQGKDWDSAINGGVDMPFPGDEVRKVPYDWAENKEAHGVHRAGSYGGFTLNADDPRWDTLKAEYKVFCLKVHKLEQEQAVFIDGVDKVINAYSTLAPALKAWPPLWDLVPSDKQEKHKEIVERRKRGDKPEIEGVNLDDMTAISTMAKLTGGS
jgi:hypothetical protein